MRYKIVDESQSVHCCFSKTVVDTTRPVMIHGEHHDDKYEAMCECIDEDAAPVICDALNAADRFRWIPVTERLPENGGRVLAYCPLLSPHEVIGATFWEGQTLKGWWTDDVQQLGATEPTHWMPLPEPPEVQ